MNSDRNGGGKIIRFPGQERLEHEGTKTTAAGARNFTLGTYLDMLRAERYVSRQEHLALVQAVEIVSEHAASPSGETIMQVREEMAQPQHTKYTICTLEQDAWRDALKDGGVPLPGVDITPAVACFMVTADDDPNRTVRFLSPDPEQPLLKYVPPQLRMAEVFFFVTLRMFRLEHNKLQRAEIEERIDAILADPPANGVTSGDELETGDHVRTGGPLRRLIRFLGRLLRPGRG